MSREKRAAKTIEHLHRHEQIPLDQNSLVILDLDRTLINSDQLVDTTLLSLEDYFDADRDSAAIVAIEVVRVQERQQRGKSFAYLEELQKQLGTDDKTWVAGLAAQVIDANRNNQGFIKQSFINQILLPGAIDVLQKLDRLGVDSLIMTAGQNLTQQYKLILFRQILSEVAPEIDLSSHYITDPKHDYTKAQMINQSFADQPQGRQFDPVLLSRLSSEAVLASRIANRQYSRVVLLDDKLANFEAGDDLNPQLITELVQANANPSKPGRLLADIGASFQSVS